MNENAFQLNRRELLQAATLTGTAGVLGLNSLPAEQPASVPFKIIDTNVSLFQWPFRRLSLDDAQTLVRKLRSLGITQAWVGSFEGLLHRDIDGVNQRLTELCQQHQELVPIGSINPELPGWEQDLKLCIEKHHMPGIRLHPNYHGYSLDDPRFTKLLKLTSKSGRLVQIAVAMEDTRTQHPRLVVPDVDLTPLSDVIKRNPGAKVQLLNYRPQSALMKRLANTPGLYFDVARVEGTDGVPKLIEQVPKGRVLFGTHAPFLMPEAALIRTHEASLLDEEALRKLLSENAEQLLRNTTA